VFGLVGTFAALTLCISASSPVQAQGFFSWLFGGSGSQRPSAQDDSDRTRITVTPRHRGEGSMGSGKLVCVRLCDGYAFPVSAGTNDDNAGAACRLGCPGAETKVFRRKGDNLDDAVAEDRSIYKKLANANAFQKSSSATCGCFNNKPAAVSGPVFNDPTMKSGDIIIVAGKAMTLKPGATQPYDKDDYIEVERSRSVPASIRNMLYAKLRIAPVVARTEQPDRRSRKQNATNAESPPPNLPNTARVALPARQADGYRVVMPSPFETQQRVADAPGAATQ
jgi:hypothetical protein